MGDANTGTGYGYLLYDLTPELQKKYITEESDPDILKRDGFEKVFERFLNAEPPNYKALRVANKEASDKEKASWKDFDPYKVRPEGMFDKSRTVYYPGGGYSIPAFENPYVLPTAQQIADREASNKAFKAKNTYDVNDYRSYQASYLDKLNTPTVDTKDFEKLITNGGSEAEPQIANVDTKDFEKLITNGGSKAEPQIANAFTDWVFGKKSLSDIVAPGVDRTLKEIPDPTRINGSPGIRDTRNKQEQIIEQLRKGQSLDTQEVDIAAGDKDAFLTKADQLLGDLKASKDAQTAERRRTKRDNTGDLAETTALLENLNFFGDDESSGDPSLIAAEYRPTPSPEPVDRLSPNMRGARNYGRENPGTYNPFLTDQVNRHFMGLPARGV